MQLYPIEVPGYLIPFIMREMDGVRVVDGGAEYCRIKIESVSVLGMFLTRRLRPSYRVRYYELSLYSKSVCGRRAFSAEVLEIQKSSSLKLDLSFEDLSAFYKFIECHFRMSFYFYVKGYCLGNFSKGRIRDAITSFLSDFELLEYGYSEKVLRNIYNKFHRKGGVYKLHKNERLSSLSL